MKHEGISDAGVVQSVEQKSETEIKPNQTDTCIIIKRVWICVILLGIYFILFYYFFNLKKSRRIRCYLKKKEAKRCRFMLGFLIFYPSINSFYSFIRPLTLSLSRSRLSSRLASAVYLSSLISKYLTTCQLNDCRQSLCLIHGKPPVTLSALKLSLWFQTKFIL